MDTDTAWRTRITCLVVIAGLWIAAWTLRDSSTVMFVVLATAALSNMVFIAAVVTTPRSRERVSYQTGYQEGFENGITIGRRSTGTPGPDRGHPLQADKELVSE